MLFLLAIESLHRLFQKNHELSLLGNLSKACESFRASFYDDDVVVFLSPSVQEVQTAETILDIFAKASGLVTNMAKAHFSQSNVIK
jgi:alpha-D-ribose 1-methylphosphonate 5-triphosphate synthase subunit PhnH